MKKRRRILTVAGVLLLIAMVNLALISGTEMEPITVSVWRLVVSGVLAFFLVLGKNSARWITVVVTAIGAFQALVATSMLLIEGPVEGDAVFVVSWFLLVTLMYGTTSGFLAFSTGVSREIRDTSDHIHA